MAQKEAFELLSVKAINTGDVRKQRQITKYIQGLATNRAVTPGAVVGKALFVGKWAYDGIVRGKFFEALTTGELGKLKMVTEHRIPLMEKGVLAKDSQGKVKTISMIAASDNPIGKLFGDYLFYLHPVNFIREALWDGSLWLRMAKKKGVVDMDSVFYKISQKSLANLLSPITSFVKIKLFDPVVNSVLKNRLVTTVKAKIASFIAKLISVGIPGVGIIVNLIVDFIGDQFFQFFLDIIVLIFLAILAIPFILLAATSPVTYLLEELETPAQEEQAEIYQNKANHIDDNSTQDFTP